MGPEMRSCPTSLVSALAGTAVHEYRAGGVGQSVLSQHFYNKTLNQDTRGELNKLNITGFSGFGFHLKLFSQPLSQSFILCPCSLWKHKLNCLGVSSTSLVFNIR